MDLNGKNRIRKIQTNIKFEFYDTFGMERFGPLKPDYYKYVDLFIFAYDTTNEFTFEKNKKH